MNAMNLASDAAGIHPGGLYGHGVLSDECGSVRLPTVGGEKHASALKHLL